MNNAVIDLAMQLISCRSLSPDDAGCQAILIKRLTAIGFTIEPMNFDNTLNFWATRGAGITLAMLGHTDVVPAGDESKWITPPFVPSLLDGMLYGRGAADMKGSLAAMVVAAEQFVSGNPNHQGRLAFLITSDEESSAVNGTVKVVEELMARDETIDYCLVGEPSSTANVGDVVKNGRRGSLNANLIIKGIQGHVAYPDLARNPIHQALPALQTLVNTQWDQGNQFFPATSLQIANLHAGTGSSNVIPGELMLQFNFRFSSELTAEQIQDKVTAILDAHQLSYEIDWNLSGLPFLTAEGELVDAVKLAVKHYTQVEPQLLTTGGTSDGRFIATMGSQVVELGPVNATIHKTNESVSIHDLASLSLMYQHIMQTLIA